MDEKTKSDTSTAPPPAMATPVGDADHPLPKVDDDLSESRSNAQKSPGADEHKPTDILTGTQKPQKGKGESKLESLDELSRDPLRTHREWYPKYGRVQKCDWCNARSEGTLHVCTTCSIRMCERCARDRRWDKDYSHFIDADALDWKPKAGLKPPRTPKATLVPKKGPSKRPALSRESSEPPPSRRRKLDSRADRERQDGDDLASSGFYSSRHSPPRAALAVPTAPYHGFVGPLQPSAPRGYYDHYYPGPPPPPLPPPPYHHLSMYPSYPPLPRMDPASLLTFDGLPASAMTSTSAAEHAARSDGREAAASARSNIREQSRHVSQSRLSDGEPVKGDHDDIEYVQVQHHRDGEDPSVEGGDAENVHMARRRRDDREVASNPKARSITPGAGTDRDHDQPAQVGSAPPRFLPPWADYHEHDLLVVDIYSSIYGDRPNLDVYRVRTQIPNHWPGDWIAPASQYHGEPHTYAHSAYYSAPNHHPAGHPYDRHPDETHSAADRPRHQGQHMYPHMYPHHSSYQHYPE
ncbi:hypothetical protein VTH06DRAFT_4330, partial [Thermothelomyces fergusii]